MGGRATVTDGLRLGWFAIAAVAVPVAVHAMTTRIANHNWRPGILPPARQALLATICAMATAAMLVALLTSLTIALRPDDVPRHRDTLAGDGICHNCDPPSIVIPPNLRHEYYVEGNVAHAGGSTLVALLIVPLVGFTVAAVRDPLPPGRSALTN
jgi:hypothetical protein